MPVPTTGPFKMFDPEDTADPINSSLKGAQLYDALDPVTNINNFDSLISAAQVPLFDPYYAGNIESISDVSGSLQFRNYPQVVSCYNCSFEEIDNPANRNITYSIVRTTPPTNANITFEGSSTFYTNATNYSNSVVKVKLLGETATATMGSFTTNEDTFIGWSYTADGSTGIIRTTNTINHIVTDDIEIFGIVEFSSTIALDFCYYGAGTGQTLICESCSTTKTTYFDRVLAATNPLEDLIWYGNSSKTTFTQSGYYRKKTTTTSTSWFGMSFTRTIIDDTIYYVNGSGEASVWNTCGEFIYCT
tara:strand:+ start:1791 stop:2702 length:912 start_codon:yes stop_codon:yes gene_type:complete